MLKLRDVFNSLSTKDGADSESRIRQAISSIEAEHDAARAELAQVAEKRTDLLLNDDDAGLDKLDRRAEALHRVLERCAFALPELQKRLASVRDRDAENARIASYELAVQKGLEAEKRLKLGYPKLAAELLQLAGIAADAIAAADAANQDLPEGRQLIEQPEIVSRATKALPEEIVGRKSVELWVFEGSENVVRDQERVRPADGGIGILEGDSRLLRCVKKTFLEVRYHPAVRRNWELRFDQLIRLPGLSPRDPDVWNPIGLPDAHLISEVAADAAAAVKAAKAPLPSRPVHVRLEPTS